MQQQKEAGERRHSDRETRCRLVARAARMQSPRITLRMLASRIRWKRELQYKLDVGEREAGSRRRLVTAFRAVEWPHATWP